MNITIHIFSLGLSLKVDVKARLEFELVYYDLAVQHFNHRAKATIHKWLRVPDTTSLTYMCYY